MLTYHYPPELMSLLIDTIPLLCRSKEDTILFIRGAGVSGSIVDDLTAKLRSDPGSINKYLIVRTVLKDLNEKGDSMLRQRREILKRVVEFEDFSTCWAQDQLKAKGLVADVRKVVNVKDSFTRMSDERQQERQTHISKQEKEHQAKEKQQQTIDGLKSQLASLFSEKDSHRRGKALEIVLNGLFAAYEIIVRESFSVTGDEGEGIIEQIDGVIELNCHLYFVEMKWWNKPIGKPEISEHLIRVYHRPESQALIISASEFTAPAIQTCKESLTHGKTVTLCSLEEIVLLLEQKGDLKEFLLEKVQRTIIDKNPYPRLCSV